MQSGITKPNESNAIFNLFTELIYVHTLESGRT